MPTDVLPDILAPGLRVVFCGTAAGTESAQRAAYYAGPGNRFWRTLAETGLTDRQLLPEEFHRLPDYGIGLTDLAKFKSGADNKLASDDFDIEGFKARIGRAPPHALAFNGVAAGRVFLGRVPRERLAPGRQPDTFARAAVFVLPSTSGSARGFWSIEPWRELAEYVRSAP